FITAKGKTVPIRFELKHDQEWMAYTNAIPEITRTRPLSDVFRWHRGVRRISDKDFVLSGQPLKNLMQEEDEVINTAEPTFAWAIPVLFWVMAHLEKQPQLKWMSALWLVLSVFQMHVLPRFRRAA